MRMYFDELLESKDVKYVSGYENDYSIVKLKCLECGCEWEMNIHNLKQKIKGNRGENTNYTPCPKCRQWKSLVELAITEDRKKQDMFIKSFGKWLKRNTIKAKKDYERYCLNCGNYFETTAKDKVYCSEQCRERARSRRKDTKRDKRISSRVRDNNITLDGLYKRDNGVCYLCGGLCDREDYKKIDGTIITGNTYPSIEHLLPISKGGTDTWDNVRLAHRICNSKKGNSLLVS